MGIINPTLPTIGDPRGNEEIDVRNALVAILNLLNNQGGNGISEANLADSAVTTAKLANLAVTDAKLAGSISNAKLAGGITNDKLAGSIDPAKITGTAVTGTVTPAKTAFTGAVLPLAAAGVTFGGDTTLYRSGVNILKTDGTLTVGAGGFFRGGTAGQVVVSDDATTPRILFGSAGDVNVYKSGAALKTDNAFAAGAGIQLTESGATSTVPRIIRGSVTSGGGITSGTGFTVTNPSTGRYTITFATAFPVAPVVNATGGGTVVPGIPATSPTTTTVDIYTYNFSGVATNGAFSFVATSV